MYRHVPALPVTRRNVSENNAIQTVGMPDRVPSGTHANSRPRFVRC